MADDKTIGVTIVGGGIAGITAALKLAGRGYEVTLYEEQPVLGGNLGAFLDPGSRVWHDVYPHMFSTFYQNFWQIVEEDLGWNREQHFQPRACVKVRKDGRYVDMTDGMPIRNALANLWGGLLPPADMLVWAYSMLDLMSQRFDRERLLDTVTVNSFLESRPYATERAAELHEFILMVVWSAHSYWVPAQAYKEFFSLNLREPSPLTWVLRGNLHEHLMLPLEKKLTELGVSVRTSHKVEQIVVRNDRVDHVHVCDLESEKSREAKVDNLILAVNPQVAGLLAQKGETVGERLVDSIPRLSEARRAHAEPVTVLDLYFKEKLPDIPRDHVSIWDSPLNVTFLDISQVWTELVGGPTVLTVAASNFYGLPYLPHGVRAQVEDAKAMLEELEPFLPQVKDAAVDMDSSSLRTVMGHQLFINTPGSQTWRPTTFNDAVPNLFLAGGYVLNPVGMATVEGAVTSGLQAAQALHEQKPLGPSVEIIPHEAYPVPAIHAMKLAMMPSAYQAKCWSAVTDLATDAANLGTPPDRGRELASLLWLPAHFAADFCQSTTELYLSTWDYLMGRR